MRWGWCCRRSVGTPFQKFFRQDCLQFLQKRGFVLGWPIPSVFYHLIPGSQGRAMPSLVTLRPSFAYSGACILRPVGHLSHRPAWLKEDFAIYAGILLGPRASKLLVPACRVSILGLRGPAWQITAQNTIERDNHPCYGVHAGIVLTDPE